MADLSSDKDLRAYLRRELGLGNASRVPDGDIDAEIRSAKAELSREVAQRVQNGDSLNFYGDNAEQALKNYTKIRFAPLARSRGEGKGLENTASRIPSTHPRRVSQMRSTDFGDSEVNYWRDRMVRALNRI